MSSKNAVAVAILIALVLGTFYLAASREPHFPTTPNTFEILSRPLPKLPTHSHADGEAVEDHGHGVYVASDEYVVPKDMWITDIQPKTVGAPFAIVHHLMLDILDEKDALCGNLNNRMLVVGMDNGKHVTFPSPYGYFIKKGLRLRVVGMLHNPEAPLGSGESYSDVAAGFELTEAKSNDIRVKPLQFYMLSVEDPPHCQDKYTFTVPPSTTSYIKSSDTEPGFNNTFATFTEDGKIIAMGTHTHGWQGGRYIEVLINGTLYKKFISVLQSMAPEVWVSEIDGAFIPIQTGDTITLNAQYINESEVPVRGAMGILGLYFSPE